MTATTEVTHGNMGQPADQHSSYPQSVIDDWLVSGSSEFGLTSWDCQMVGHFNIRKRATSCQSERHTIGCSGKE